MLDLFLSASRIRASSSSTTLVELVHPTVLFNSLLQASNLDLEV